MCEERGEEEEKVGRQQTGAAGDGQARRWTEALLPRRCRQQLYRCFRALLFRAHRAPILPRWPTLFSLPLLPATAALTFPGDHPAV